MARAKGMASIDVPTELRNLLTKLAEETGKHRSEILMQALTAYDPNPIEISEKVQKAIDAGATLAQLQNDGLEWAAGRYLGQANTNDATDLSALSDEEIETIPIEQAKQMKGLAKEKIRRTITRLQQWNDAHPQQPIDITSSFVLDTRNLFKRLTGGKITGVSRNLVFKDCKEFFPLSDFPRGHNATINAEALAVQAFQDLLEDKIQPIYRSVYEAYLAS